MDNPTGLRNNITQFLRNTSIEIYAFAMKIRDEINGRLKDYISSQKKVTSEIALVQRRTIGRYSLNLISSLNPSVSLLQQLEAQVAKLFCSEVHIPLLTRIKERIKEERKKKK